jgi:hypothetical protein
VTEKRMSQAEALYDFSAQQSGDLPFKKGDIIHVTAKDGQWWTGSCGGKSGTFPCNYVKEMPASRGLKHLRVWWLISDISKR